MSLTESVHRIVAFFFFFFLFFSLQNWALCGATYVRTHSVFSDAHVHTLTHTHTHSTCARSDPSHKASLTMSQHRDRQRKPCCCSSSIAATALPAVPATKPVPSGRKRCDRQWMQAFTSSQSAYDGAMMGQPYIAVDFHSALLRDLPPQTTHALISLHVLVVVLIQSNQSSHSSSERKSALAGF